MIDQDIQAWADAYFDTLPPPHECPYGWGIGHLVCMTPFWKYTKLDGPEYKRSGTIGGTGVTWQN